jgi:hypothetical protein
MFFFFFLFYVLLLPSSFFLLVFASHAGWFPCFSGGLCGSIGSGVSGAYAGKAPRSMEREKRRENRDRETSAIFHTC